VSVLRSRERGCFLVVQTLWAEKIQSTTDAGSLNTFGRNEIEVAPISSALLRIGRLVILNKTCRVPDQELAADRVSSSNFTVCLFAFENRSGIRWPTLPDVPTLVRGGDRGAPPAFAVCAAGRLTVKELTKCLSAQIGTEGGCFGPHNTIVEAFATVGHDLGSCLSGGACLGPNNEIVKAAKAIEEGVSHLGHEGERIWNGLFGRGSDWCRGTLTGWTCG
jgi:hypothetical protein